MGRGSGHSSGVSRSSTAQVVAAGGDGWRGPSGERSAQVHFERNPAPTVNYETIWPSTGDLDYLAAPATASLLTAVADDGKTIKVTYLTTDFAPAPPVTLTCNNATPPTIPNFLRFLRASVSEDGGTRLTADAVLDVGGQTVGLIAANESVSQIANFTIPKDNLGGVCFVFVNIPVGKTISLKLQKREVLDIGPTASWQDLETLEDIPEGTHMIPFCLKAIEAWSSIKLDPGTDFRLQCLAGGPNQSVSGHFVMIAQPIPAELLV